MIIVHGLQIISVIVFSSAIHGRYRLIRSLSIIKHQIFIKRIKKRKEIEKRKKGKLFLSTSPLSSNDEKIFYSFQQTIKSNSIRAIEVDSI